MIPFKTTDDQVIHIATVVVEMKKADLEPAFIVAASELARTDQGVYDLMALWLDAKGDDPERAEIVADLQEAIDDYQDAPSSPIKKPYINYEQLDEVGDRVIEEKARLRDLIDRHGGVSAVARKSGIPQPSLSRMLNSASIPRKSTLYKIANALDIPESEIVMEWTR